MYRLPLVCLSCLALIGCDAPNPPAVAALPPDAGAQTRQLAELKDAMDAVAPLPVSAPVTPLIGRGYSQVAGQKAKLMNEKRLLAIRAARMDALRDLAEQIHGVSLDGQSTVRDAVLRDDALATRVAGMLYGARTRSIRPLEADGYEVELEIDPHTVGYIVRMARKGG
jgi:outer membrane protein FlgP